MKTHELKTWPEFYDAVASGRKTFEVRYDDRGYEVGDVLHLRKYDPATKDYADAPTLVRRVSYIFADRKDGVELALGYVVLGLEPPLAARVNVVMHYAVDDPGCEGDHCEIELEDFDADHETILRDTACSYHASGPQAVGFIKGLDYARRVCGLPECQVGRVDVADYKG